MWWYGIVEHSLYFAFYAFLLGVLIAIAVGYDLFRLLRPVVAFIWDVLTTALYWPVDKLLDLLHVPRADTEEEYERKMDERDT